MKLSNAELEALLVLAEAADRGGALQVYTHLDGAERAPAHAAAHATAVVKLRLFHAYRKGTLG